MTINLVYIGFAIIIFWLLIALRVLWVKQKRHSCPHDAVKAIISRGYGLRISKVKCVSCGKKGENIWYETDEIFKKLDVKLKTHVKK